MPSLRFELKFGYPQAPIIGVDEVGRGCLAGSVIAAAAVVPHGEECARWAKCLPRWLRRVNDSKQLDAEARTEIAHELREKLLCFAIGEASVLEIDEINIYHASHLAMIRAIEGLPELYRGAFVLVDGNVVPKRLAPRAHPIIRGDSHSVSIAAASILAKVHRDQMMVELDAVHPDYGFASHKGYGTPEHQAALDMHGVLAVHRRTFAPVRERLGLSDSNGGVVSDEQMVLGDFGAGN